MGIGQISSRLDPSKDDRRTRLMASSQDRRKTILSTKLVDLKFRRQALYGADRFFPAEGTPMSRSGQLHPGIFMWPVSIHRHAEGLDDFADRVIPELQRRGLFRREYEGSMLREHLGLPRPENRFFRPAD